MNGENGANLEHFSDYDSESNGARDDAWEELGAGRQEERNERAWKLERDRIEKGREDEPKYKQERREAEAEAGLERLGWKEREEKQEVGEKAIREYERNGENERSADVEGLISRFRELFKAGEDVAVREYGDREAMLEGYKEAKIGTEEGLYKLSWLTPKKQVEFLFEDTGEHAEQKRDYFEERLKGVEELIGSIREGDRSYSSARWKPLARMKIRDAVMEASMVGTPEYSAYVAGKHAQQARYADISEIYPVVKGAKSGIDAGKIGDWKEILGEYKRIENKVKEEHPEATEEQIRKWAVSRAREEYADSYGFAGVRGRASFADAVAWGQMNKEVQNRINGIVREGRPVDGIRRFVGRGAKEDRKASSMRREYMFLYGAWSTEPVEESNDREIRKQEQFLEKERVRINKKYDKLGEKLESERRKAKNEEERARELEKLEKECGEKIEYYQGRTKEQRDEDIEVRRGELWRKIEKRKSVLEKALDLKFAYLKEADQTDFGGWAQNSSDDWLRFEKFGDIKRAHRMLRRGASVREIESARVRQRLKEVVGEAEDEGLAKRIEAADLSGRSWLVNQYRMALEAKGTGYEMSPYLKAVEEMGKTRFLEYISRGPELEWLSEEEAVEFPFSGGDKARELWCAKHAAADVSAFPEGRIGKIIYSRLKTGVDADLHDASFWLYNFRVPNRGQDIEGIKADVKAGVEGVPDKFKQEGYEVELKDGSEEWKFLDAVMKLPVEERRKLRLSGKETVVNEMFAESPERWVYEELLKLQKSDLSGEEIRKKIRENTFKIEEEIREGGEEVGKQGIRPEDFEALRSLLLTDYGGEKMDLRQISKEMSELRGKGQRRKKYVDDTVSWLTRHMTTPSDDLRRAWGDGGEARATALVFGEQDSARAVNMFWARRGVMEETLYMERAGLSPEELSGKYKGLVDEVVRCGAYTPHEVIDIVAEYRDIHNPEKLMPADMRAIEIEGKKFKAGVLAHDDPRGYTIGPDTGCCMHYHGVSENCIEQGYSDKQAGFFAMYGPDERLSAQSFFYVNPERPDVLVLDNIEARGQGRDASGIVDVYKEYFKGYLTEQFEENPEWQVREVHIGTRYGELVKPIVKRLQGAEIVLNHNVYTYTDAAENQVLLLRLSEAEVEEARLRGAVKRGEVKMGEEEVKELAGESMIAEQVQVEPNHEPEEFVSRLGMEQGGIMRELEERLYPEGMRQYTDGDFLESELGMPEVEKYSFLISSQEGATKRPVGYCLAYKAKSEVEANEDCVYVADFGVIPEGRGGWAALKGFRELVQRVKESGGGAIEMGAREATSYRIMSSPATQRVLRRMGYEVRDLGIEDEFSEGERTYLLRLEPVQGE